MKRNVCRTIVALALCAVMLFVAGCSGQPAAEEPTAEEPVAEEVVAEEPVAEEAVAEEPAEEEPAAEEPTTEEPDTNAADIVAGEDIVPPAGKQILNVPVDVVADDTIRIASIGMNTNPFDLKVYEGIEFAGEVLADRNIECDFVSIKEHNITQFEETIRNCLAAGYDAITCNGFGPQLETLIAEANEEGVPFFLFNNPTSDTSEEMSFWGQSGFEGGKKLAEMALEQLGAEEGEYAIITGDFNLSGHEDRRKGFRSVMDELEGMELVLETENNDLYEKAYEITTNLLTSNPDLKVLYVTAGGPFGAAKAIEDAGMSGEVIMVCHDWMDETIPYVRSGTISGCLDQDPFTQGFAPIVDAYNYLAADIEPNKENLIDGEIATPDNVSELIPE